MENGVGSTELEDQIRQLNGSQVMPATGYYLKEPSRLVGNGELQRVENKNDIVSYSFGFIHLMKVMQK